MTSNKFFGLKSTVLALSLMCGALTSAYAGVTITISNINEPGVGFNDTTPATPVGGNPGTTLGEQRLFAFTYAANIWGSTLDSAVPIIIAASFEPLTCTATSGTLGSAGATSVFVDFPGAQKAGTIYSGALTSKLSGEDANFDPDTGTTSAHIRARFNSNLGLTPTCLPGSPFYLGVDNNHGSLIDFPTVLLHEMGHGLGFQTFTSGSTGMPYAGYPSIWDHYLLDTKTGKTWVDSTPTERIASAISGNGLSWTGANVTAAARGVLRKAPNMAISGSAAGTAAGNYEVGEASFGAPLSDVPVTANLEAVIDQPDGATGLACNPLSAANTSLVRNKIALVSRGVCAFSIKAKNLQNAGAVGMVVADNVAASLSGLGGTDATVVIPSVRITLANGNTLKTRLATRTRTKFVVASLGLSQTAFAGTDSQGRVLVNTPNPFQPGSSVSHYTTATSRNQLMEPAISGDLTHSPLAPVDLTFELFKDIGW